MKEKKILENLYLKLKKAGYIELSKDVKKIAQQLQPVGEVYKENDKFYRKFYDSSKGLMIKEVDQNGNIITAESPKQQTWGEWLSELNPFSDSKSEGFWSNVDEATKKKEQEQPPKTNPAKDVNTFTSPTSDNDR